MFKGLCFLLFCIICPDAFAAIFDVAPSDKSQEYLSLIFGNKIGGLSLQSPHANHTLALMFEKFNFIIVTFGSIVLGYIALLSTFNTAREGEALGKKLSAWTVIRAITGMIFMIPTPASGYSLVQMTVMWIVLNGIGAANAIWGVVLGQLEQGTAPIVSTQKYSFVVPPEQVIQTVGHSALHALTCMHFLNDQMPRQHLNSLVGAVTISSSQAQLIISPEEGSGTRRVIVGAPQDQDVSDQQICGVFEVNTALTKDQIPEGADIHAIITERLNIKTEALVALLRSLDPTAAILAMPNAASPPAGALESMSETYIHELMALERKTKVTAGTQPPVGESSSTNTLHRLRAYGWIHAGSYYYRMLQAGQNATDPEINRVTAIMPIPSLVPIQNNGIDGTPWPTNDGTTSSALSHLFQGHLQEKSNFNNALSRANRYFQQNFTGRKSATRGITSAQRTFGNKYVDVVVATLRQKIHEPILAYVHQVVEGTDQDPLISIGNFGSMILWAAEMSIIASIILSITLSTAAMGLSPVINFFALQVMPLVYGAGILLWTAGATLGIYIPMIPYLIFTTSAFGWMVAVVEAMVGAPIIALGMTNPSGEELGKVGSALVILANLFLRPTLMIFGFILGTGLLRGGIALVNFGFMPALNEATMPSLFSIMAVLMMYMFLMIAIINKSFSLIYMLPNQIMRWMGAPSEQSDPSEMIRETKGGFESGAGKGQAMVEQANKLAQSKLGKKNAPPQGGGQVQPP